MAALAVIIMCLGTMIPAATYAAPILCMHLCCIIRDLCGNRTAWAWYGAVAILGLLMAPDKEAAGVFLALGYYPIVKPGLDRKKLPWLWKALLFNGSVLLLYWLLLKLIGLDSVTEDFSGTGMGMILLLLALGNFTFFLMDWALARSAEKRKRRKGRAPWENNQ